MELPKTIWGAAVPTQQYEEPPPRVSTEAKWGAYTSPPIWQQQCHIGVRESQLKQA